MLKKMMLAATAVAALMAIGAQTASADWYHSGTALKSGENPSLETTGTVAFTSSAGGVHCATGTATLQATGGTTDGHVPAFGAEEIGKCEVSGGLAFLTGGTTTLSKVTLTEGTTLTVDAATGDVTVSAVSLHNEFKNGFELTLSSQETPLTIKPTTTKAITSGALSGKLNSTLGTAVTVTGSQTVLAPNSGTYGTQE